MSVTGEVPASKKVISQHVEKLANSSVFRGSESLCRLLRYLGEHSLAQPGIVIKEYQIATEVFGRAPDFDPKLDATVRVQTSRLRTKLIEYYAGEGADDQWILELPKGSYSLLIHNRPEVHPRHEPVSAIGPANPALPARVPTRQLMPAIWVLSAVSIGLLGMVTYLIASRPAPAPADAATSQATSALRALWGGFINTPSEPLVVFSNAEFVGRPETGMRYFDPLRDSRSAILDHYSGVGEVLAIHEIDRLFARLNHGLRVKRGGLLSLDDVKANDVIFVGSPSENLTLREIPSTREFIFRRRSDDPRKGDLEVSNVHPQAGEQANFMASPSNMLSEDYAVIGAFPANFSGQWIMTLAGITTIGTQAAVEYVCSEPEVRGLVARAGVSSRGTVAPFEALVYVKVSRGVPVNSKLVALHRRTGMAEN
jgi:hypothetical protein